MSVKKTKPVRFPVADLATQRAFDEHADTIQDVARDPVIQRRTFFASLPDGVAVTLNHGLGRKLEQYIISGFVGAVTPGRIVESEPVDALRHLVLQADDFGADITVRITVF